MVMKTAAQLAHQCVEDFITIECWSIDRHDRKAIDEFLRAKEKKLAEVNGGVYKCRWIDGYITPSVKVDVIIDETMTPDGRYYLWEVDDEGVETY